MDALRTLLLARTHVVVLDADLAANAVTRPARGDDVEKFEDELAQLGFVMSLDLAVTIRRMPSQAIQELRAWTVDTLAATIGAHRPHVPLFRAFPSSTPTNSASLYLRRVLPWLLTHPDQPCPWCGQVKAVGALDPCGHVVCRACWDAGAFVGCPICHRRVALGDPFVMVPPPPHPTVTGHGGELRLVHLGFDLLAMARARFEQLLGRTTPLSREDRAELETVIDTLGPKAATWIPRKVAVRETLAVVIARLWLVAPDRHAILRATINHLKSATDVLRVAIVLLGGDPGLGSVARLGPIARGLRRLVLEALDTLPPEALVEEVQRHRALWKRVGERLHPYEHATRLPTAALAFAVARGTKVSTASFGATLGAQANQMARARIEDDRVRVTAWAGVIEDGLRAGEVRAVAERLAQRPAELLRRADHLLRVTQAMQPEASATVLRAITTALPRATPTALLTLAGHVARRDAPWPHRVMFPKASARRAWSMPDQRSPLRPETIGALVDAIRGELVARAGAHRHFPRALIDRGLGAVPLRVGERRAATAADYAALIGTGARPTVWDLACVHAATRANLVYVRERDGGVTQYRWRDDETAPQRLARVLAATDHDGALASIPHANAPTWVALLEDDLGIPMGSEGYLRHSALTDEGVTRLGIDALLAQLASR